MFIYLVLLAPGARLDASRPTSTPGQSGAQCADLQRGADAAPRRIARAPRGSGAAALRGLPRREAVTPRGYRGALFTGRDSSNRAGRIRAGIPSHTPGTAPAWRGRRSRTRGTCPWPCGSHRSPSNSPNRGRARRQDNEEPVWHADHQHLSSNAVGADSEAHPQKFVFRSFTQTIAKGLVERVAVPIRRVAGRPQNLRVHGDRPEVGGDRVSSPPPRFGHQCPVCHPIAPHPQRARRHKQQQGQKGNHGAKPTEHSHHVTRRIAKGPKEGMIPFPRKVGRPGGTGLPPGPPRHRPDGLWQDHWGRSRSGEV
ncbi:MAG: hypothetical protein JWM97_2457 [Phycisphaerales bacterium]|nr:hypothetical protein [Phycisphaerales bacterium]